MFVVRVKLTEIWLIPNLLLYAVITVSYRFMFGFGRSFGAVGCHQNCIDCRKEYRVAEGWFCALELRVVTVF